MAPPSTFTLIGCYPAASESRPHFPDPDAGIIPFDDELFIDEPILLESVRAAHCLEFFVPEVLPQGVVPDGAPSLNPNSFAEDSYQDWSFHDFFWQPDAPYESQQAPSSVAYLNPEGTDFKGTYMRPEAGTIEALTAIPEPPFRLVFFLHFLDFARPLRTPFGEVALPKPTPPPKRLTDLIEYELPT